MISHKEYNTYQIRFRKIAMKYKSHIINKILKHKYASLEHFPVIGEIKEILEKEGFIVTLEWPIKTYKNGFIDLYAKTNKPNSSYSIALEVDGLTPRYKSLEKIEWSRSNLGIVITRGKRLYINAVTNKIMKSYTPLVVININTKAIVYSNLQQN